MAGPAIPSCTPSTVASVRSETDMPRLIQPAAVADTSFVRVDARREAPPSTGGVRGGVVLCLIVQQSSSNSSCAPHLLGSGSETNKLNLEGWP